MIDRCQLCRLSSSKQQGNGIQIDWFDRQQVASTCSRRIQVWDHFPNSASGSNESPKTLRSLVWLREDVEPTLTAWFHRSCLQQRWMALNQYHSQSNKLNATPNQWRVDQKPNYKLPQWLPGTQTISLTMLVTRSVPQIRTRSSDSESTNIKIQLAHSLTYNWQKYEINPSVGTQPVALKLICKRPAWASKNTCLKNNAWQIQLTQAIYGKYSWQQKVTDKVAAYKLKRVTAHRQPIGALISWPGKHWSTSVRERCNLLPRSANPLVGSNWNWLSLKSKSHWRQASYNHQSTQLKFKGSGIRRQPFYQWTMTYSKKWWHVFPVPTFPEIHGERKWLSLFFLFFFVLFFLLFCFFMI